MHYAVEDTPFRLGRLHTNATKYEELKKIKPLPVYSQYLMVHGPVFRIFRLILINL
jgi:hypothetical protein